jgi:glycosyltransferase involved in cell wall biosynthesis
VVPCYNAERWLEACLDSALSQTWPAVEVVVVDDGSSDRSVEVARGFGDRIVLVTGPNAGASAARNRGIAIARGRWIQLLDADDLLLPRKIEACLAAVGEPSREIPFSRHLTFGGAPERPWSGWVRARPPVWTADDPVRMVLTHEILISGPVYPADLLRVAGGFRAGMRWLEDIDLNLRLALDGARLVLVDEALGLIREHSTPGRQRLAPGVARGRIEGERLMLASVRDAGRLDRRLAEVFADRLAYAARQAWLAGEELAAGEAFAEARSLSRWPRPTAVPLYNAAANLMGHERLERLVGLRRG